MRNKCVNKSFEGTAIELSSPLSPFSLSLFLSLSLGQVNCHGHEQVDDSISVSLDITNLRVDAFVKSGRDASSGETNNDDNAI